MEEKNKTKEIDIPCACAIGDLSKFAPVNADKKTKKIVLNKDSKKENSNNNI